jgi:hypothetical protein
MQARVLQPLKDTHQLEYVSISDQEAEELSGKEIVAKLAANRAATASESVVSVKVSGGISGESSGTRTLERKDPHTHPLRPPPPPHPDLAPS